MTADQAIARSVSHNEIVTIQYKPGVEATLCLECDGSVDAGKVHEYWGTDADGYEWRVHVISQAPAAEVTQP